MRALLFTLFISILPGVGAQPPLPFPEMDPKWSIHAWANSAPPAGLTTWPLGTYSTSGDTLINGHYYHKLIFTNASGSMSYHSAVRDVAAKWLFIPPDEETEYLIYDFGAEVDDTVMVNNPFADWSLEEPMPVQMIVTSIQLDTILARRRWELHLIGSSYWTAHWIEGIGDMAGLVEPYFGYAADGGWTLQCFQENGTTVFPVPSGHDCAIWLTVPEETAGMPAPCLFPNPGSGYVEISMDTDPLMVTVNTMDGRTVRMIRNGRSFDVSTLPSGIYMVRITDREQRQFTKRLLVER